MERAPGVRQDLPRQHARACSDKGRNTLPVICKTFAEERGMNGKKKGDRCNTSLREDERGGQTLEKGHRYATLSWGPYHT